MAKNRKVVRYRKPFHLNIGVVIFGIIFIYVMFYVFSYFTTTQTSAYEVIPGTIAINNSYTGLALRSEEIVNASESGLINYYIKDASKVGSGDLICSIDTDGSIARQINSANEDSSELNADNLTQIQELIQEYSGSYEKESFYNVYTFKDDLNAEISEALSMNALNGISDAVTAAEGNATFHKETAVRDGIVVYYTDGFESVTAENFTADMFDESRYNKTNLKDQSEIASGDAIYKLITSEDWNLVIPVTDATVRQLGDASTVRIRFKKDNTTMRASFTTEERDGTTYLILSMSNSMIRFASDRYIEVELLFEEESGLKIPNSAIAGKDFFTIPMEYFKKGDDSSKEGVIIRKKDKAGNVTDTFVTPNIYFATETSYYVDGDEIQDQDVLLKPDSTETYTVHDTAKLNGIYCINKGYAVFRQIDIIYQNEEYAIIRNGTEYGVSMYDHIALDGSTVTENALIHNK